MILPCFSTYRYVHIFTPSVRRILIQIVLKTCPHIYIILPFFILSFQPKVFSTLLLIYAKIISSYGCTSSPTVCLINFRYNVQPALYPDTRPFYCYYVNIACITVHINTLYLLRINSLFKQKFLFIPLM